ncbi:MAG: type II toxin-antitoxin system VapC family toxin [Myxococcota bacterium]
MDQPFDRDAIAKLGWRQGAILDVELAKSACKHAPATVTIGDSDWLIVTSHDCDVVNFSLDKEPVVEVMRARVLAAKKVDKQQSSGRNPRTMQLAVADGNEPVVLSLSVHDRWFIPRAALLREKPARYLPDRERRLIAEWLAKLIFDIVYLLDTNVLSELRKADRANSRVRKWFDRVSESQLFTSVMVVAEIRLDVERKAQRDPEQSAVLERWLKGLLHGFADRIVPVDVPIALRFAELQSHRSRPSIDVMLASSALERDLIVVTRNTKDLEGTRVRVLNPFESRRVRRA